MKFQNTIYNSIRNQRARNISKDMQNFYIENNGMFLNETYILERYIYLHELENSSVKSQFSQIDLIKLTSN